MYMPLDLKQWFAEAADEERGCPDLPDRAVPDTPYREKTFGQFFPCDEHYRGAVPDITEGAFAAGASRFLPDSVVSLALFDGTCLRADFFFLKRCTDLLIIINSVNNSVKR